MSNWIYVVGFMLSYRCVVCANANHTPTLLEISACLAFVNCQPVYLCTTVLTYPTLSVLRRDLTPLFSLI